MPCVKALKVPIWVCIGMNDPWVLRAFVKCDTSDKILIVKSIIKMGDSFRWTKVRASITQESHKVMSTSLMTVC